MSIAILEVRQIKLHFKKIIEQAIQGPPNLKLKLAFSLSIDRNLVANLLFKEPLFAAKSVQQDLLKTNYRTR